VPTRTWVGTAANVTQVDTITIANTWAGNDIARVTINGNTVQITVGTGTTTAAVAEALAAAINATDLTTGLESDEVRNVPGQKIPEFTEVTAEWESGATFTVTGNTAGKPFTMTAGETTAGDGTCSLANTTAATGKNHWDNAANWSGGIAPVNDDTVMLKDSDVSILYGLPANVEVTLEVYMTYTGKLGLAARNLDNAAQPYAEYRTRYLDIDDGGGGSALTHKFGIGPGTGSPLMNVQLSSTSALVHSAVVYNTGTPQINGTKALNLTVHNNASSAGTITVLKGSVDLGMTFSLSMSIATLNIGYTTAQASDSDVSMTANAAALTINQTGGHLYISNSAVVVGNLTISINGGETISGIVTATTVACTISNGRLIWNATETIDTLIIGTGGILDLEKDSRAVTISTCDLFEGASLFDEYARGTYTAGVDLNRCGVDDVKIRVGNNRRLTLGTAA
jgi:hypothetical protein